jgi:hypothetical protein
MARDLLGFSDMSRSSILAAAVFAVGLLAFLVLVSGGPRLLSDAAEVDAPSKTIATQIEIEPGTWIAYEELPSSF